ncbi:MAG: crossover junction endodeoxyribonuclease RuvC [Deltaproteobacteria bacterium]
MLTLGLDPGSRVTGFGLVHKEGPRWRAVEAGALSLGQGPLPERLAKLHAGLSALLSKHRPDAVAVEAIFSHKGLRSALILGHARGVALLAVAQAGLSVNEYPPATVKRSLTQGGARSKGAVARAVFQLLGISGPLPADATDALAVAICHLSRNRLLATDSGAPSPFLRALAAAPQIAPSRANLLLKAALRGRAR